MFEKRGNRNLFYRQNIKSIFQGYKDRHYYTNTF